MSRKRVVVYMPARNTAHLLERTLSEIPEGIADEIILVDNASSDNTADMADRLGLHVIRNPTNLGYGGSQKIGYREALKHNADIVAMLHSDAQYDPSLLGDMLSPIVDGRADCTLGSRIMAGDVLQRGMPLIKFLANRTLSNAMNFLLRARISEYQTGYRAYSRTLLETVAFERNSDDWLFDTEMLFQIIHGRFAIHEVPVLARYSREMSAMGLKDGFVYTLGCITALAEFSLHRYRLRQSPKYRPKPNTSLIEGR